MACWSLRYINDLKKNLELKGIWSIPQEMCLEDLVWFLKIHRIYLVLPCSVYVKTSYEISIWRTNCTCNILVLYTCICKIWTFVMIYTWAVYFFYVFLIYCGWVEEQLWLLLDCKCCYISAVFWPFQSDSVVTVFLQLPRPWSWSMSQVILKEIVHIYDTNYWSVQNTAKISSGYFTNYFHS